MPIKSPFPSRHDKTDAPYVPLVSEIDSPYDSGTENSEAVALLPISEVKEQHDLSEELSDPLEVPLPQRHNNRLRSALTFLRSTTEALLPAYLTTFFSYVASIFSRLIGRTVDRPKRETPRPTAYLDGLRGVAALIVYMYHAVYLFYPGLHHGFGVDGDNRYFWQITIIRVLHSGGGSVCVFFVISGFVLTISALTKIHKRASNNDVLATMAGTTFRRPFRLFLPIIASTLMNALVQYKGLKIKHGGSVVQPEASLGLQLLDWWRATVDHLDHFRHLNGREHLRGHKYDGHTWTIPFEIKGSLLVMMMLMMFSKVKRWVHVLGSVCITYWLVLNGGIDSAMFIAGMLLAELSIVAPGRAKSSDDCSLDEGPRKRTFGLWCLRMMRNIAVIFLFFFSLHLLSFPDSIAPGFEFLRFAPDFYTDPHSVVGLRTFWHAVGATLFILSLMYSPSPSSLLPTFCRTRLPWHQAGQHAEKGEQTPPEPLFQSFFTTNFTQYLGRISYALYLMHGLVNESLGSTLLNPSLTAWAKTEAEAKVLANAKKVAESEALLAEGNASYQADFLYFIVVNTLVLFWVGDLFYRFVDKPAVQFTRWLSTLAGRKDD